LGKGLGFGGWGLGWCELERGRVGEWESGRVREWENVEMEKWRNGKMGRVGCGLSCDLKQET